MSYDKMALSLLTMSAKAIGKSLRKEKIKETLHLCKETWGDDVLTNGGFITGLPYETPDTMNVWCQELFDKKYPLDTWYLTTLAFMNRGKDVDEYPYSSNFEKDPAKYGYTFDKDDPTNWNNGTFTKNCQQVCRILERKMERKNKSWKLA